MKAKPYLAVVDDTVTALMVAAKSPKLAIQKFGKVLPSEDHEVFEIGDSYLITTWGGEARTVEVIEVVVLGRRSKKMNPKPYLAVVEGITTVLMVMATSPRDAIQMFGELLPKQNYQVFIAEDGEILAKWEGEAVTVSTIEATVLS